MSGLWISTGLTQALSDSQQRTLDQILIGKSDQAIASRDWSLSASHNNESVVHAIDGDIESRWTTREAQKPGQELIIDLGQLQSFDELILDSGDSSNDYPRGFAIYTSVDGQDWGQAVATGEGSSARTVIRFDQQSAQYLRVEQTKTDSFYWWSVNDISLFNNAQITPTNGLQMMSSETWQATASHNQAAIQKAFDTDPNTRWTTKLNQQNGQSIDIDFGRIATLDRMLLQSSYKQQSRNDYPRGLTVYTSENGNEFTLVASQPADQQTASEGDLELDLNGRDARFLRLEQTGFDDFFWWSIHELILFEEIDSPTSNSLPVISLTLPTDIQDLSETNTGNVQVTASDPDGEIAWVDLFFDGEFVRRENQSPYQWPRSEFLNLSTLADGTHSLRFVAADDQGATSELNLQFDVAGDDSPPNPDDDPGGDSDSDADEVVHRYPANQGAERNPMKGWNAGWFDDRPESTVGFQYIDWNVFEPRNNVFDFDAVEQLIDRPGSRNRHVILRLYCDWHGETRRSRGCPEWMYTEMGVERIKDDNGRYITDYNDSNYLEQAVQAIKALGQRYDNDPRVYAFQLGVLGYWGEWHTHPSSIDDERYRISVEAENTILNAYRKYFPNTLLMGRYPNRSTLRSTTDIGFHNDFFRPNSGHSDDFDQAIDRGARWKEGPIGGEIPPGLSNKDFTDLYQNGRGEQIINLGRYSTMKPTDVFSQHRASHLELHKQFGYRFEIKQAVFAEQASKQDRFKLGLTVLNSGIAPFYYDWPVQFALLDSSNRVMEVKSLASPRLTALQPNSQSTFESNLDLANLATGNYKVAVRINQPGADAIKPAPWKLTARNTYIEFANDMEVIDGSWGLNNELQGGWTVLGEVTVK